MYAIKFSPLAQSDLEEVQSYISHTLHNPVAAKNLLQKIKEAVFSLRTFPQIGAPLAINGQMTIYRYLACKNYLIFYHIDDMDVRVDRVLYGRRDYLSILFDDMTKGDCDQ